MTSALARPHLQGRRPALRRLLAGPAAAMAKGTPRGESKRAVVALDASTFDRIAMLAALSRVSFGEAVRQLLVLGLQAHEEEQS